jgi:acyl-CoA synthetase (AMP-forming)/AMP-acid ligase II
MLAVSVCDQTTLWQMSPGDFHKRPVGWLECFGRHGATIGAAPTFAYAYLARRVGSEQLTDMDFSGWRAAVTGGERLDPASLDSFLKLLSPYGFRAEALCPAYGLAEATLAVTGARPGSTPRAAVLGRTALRQGAAVPVDAELSLSTVPSADMERAVVASGSPLPGAGVEVVSEDGVPLSPGTLGEIAVRSPGVAGGYVAVASHAGSHFRDGRLFTGDAGFLLGDRLYVLGRMGESLKVRGRTVYCEAVEIAIASALGEMVGLCAVVASQDRGWVVAMIERPRGDWVNDVADVLRTSVGPGVGLRIYAVAPGTIPRTTSGKPRRRRIWQNIASGRFDAQPVFVAP